MNLSKNIVSVAASASAFFGAAQLLRTIGLARRRDAQRDAVIGAIGAFTLGVATGGGIGLLFAPRPGRRLREDLAHRVREMGDRVRTARVREADHEEPELLHTPMEQHS